MMPHQAQKPISSPSLDHTTRQLIVTPSTLPHRRPQIWRIKQPLSLARKDRGSEGVAIFLRRLARRWRRRDIMLTCFLLGRRLLQVDGRDSHTGQRSAFRSRGRRGCSDLELGERGVDLVGVDFVGGEAEAEFECIGSLYFHPN